MSEASHSTLMRAIMHTLAYADVFDYPLTAPEVHRHLTGTRASVETLARALDEATQGCLIARVDGYFTLLDRESIVEIRKRRAKVIATVKDIPNKEILLTEFSTTGWTKVMFEKDIK